MMRIDFWGTRGSIASPGNATIRYGGNTTCVTVTLSSGRLLIFDAGTGIRPLGHFLCRMEGPLDLHLLISHIHWDHIIGFPFFEPLYRSDTIVRVGGCLKAISGLKITFDNRMLDGLFPVEFHKLRATVEPLETLSRDPLHVDDAIVEAIEIEHPQGGLGFRIRDEGRTLVFLTDNELREDASSGRRPDDYRRFCEGADLLIHDSQYLPSEIEERKGWGHSDCVSAVDLAIDSGIPDLILFHHDPQRTDAEMDRMVEIAALHARKRGSSLHVFGAQEGQSWIL